MPEITPEQSLINLEKVAANYKGTLEEHQILQMSVSVLKAVIAKKEKKTKEDKQDDSKSKR